MTAVTIPSRVCDQLERCVRLIPAMPSKIVGQPFTMFCWREISRCYPFLVSAGALYASDSELFFDRNNSFRSNSASASGGKET